MSHTQAFGINDVGQIVGHGASSFTGGIAVVSASPTAPPIALPFGGGDTARGINNAGEIVGGGHVLWTPVQRALLFLHAQGTSLFLDANVPPDATADFRDSASFKFLGGNVWKTIGTWSGPETGSPQTLKGLGDLHVWLGLKNSDDQGTRFDLLAEVLRAGVPIASGEIYCITGVTRNPAKAFEVTVPFGAIEDAEFAPHDVLSLRMSARIGTDGNGTFCGGHASAGGLRLYFDADSRPAHFEVAFELGF